MVFLFTVDNLSWVSSNSIGGWASLVKWLWYCHSGHQWTHWATLCVYWLCDIWNIILAKWLFRFRLYLLIHRISSPRGSSRFLTCLFLFVGFFIFNRRLFICLSLLTITIRIWRQDFLYRRFGFLLVISFLWIESHLLPSLKPLNCWSISFCCWLENCSSMKF